MNQQTLAGNWKQLRGKLQERWGELTDDELDEAEGNFDQVIGLIQQKTGEARESIEQALDKMCGECDGNSIQQKASQYAQQASDTAKAYAQGASESLQHSGEAVSDAVLEGYHQTENLVRTRPVESLAVTFGVGLITGVVVGLMIRRT